VYKSQILELAKNPRKLAKLPTKQRITVALPRMVSISATAADVRRLTIDDIDSFMRVRKSRKSGMLPGTVSESQFKRGVQAVLGEPGTFKDWGGETSDLYSTRLRPKGKRLAAAFAFKGPGLKTKLVLGKMGKNGDQLPRLFQKEADVFIVQHLREVDPLVIRTMRDLAIAKSVTSGRRLSCGVIDGSDSHRLYLAYPAQFSANARRKSGGN
jgi:hypothetical protein